jgi:tRNA-dihydrouridine synthase
MKQELPLFSAHKLCVAPMLDWSDRHCRYFHRLLTSNVVLYTEMVTTGALLNGDVERHLGSQGYSQPSASPQYTQQPTLARPLGRHQSGHFVPGHLGNRHLN